MDKETHLNWVKYRVALMHHLAQTLQTNWAAAKITSNRDRVWECFNNGVPVAEVF